MYVSGREVIARQLYDVIGKRYIYKIYILMCNAISRCSNIDVYGDYATPTALSYIYI